MQILVSPVLSGYLLQESKNIPQNLYGLTKKILKADLVIINNPFMKEIKSNTHIVKTTFNFYMIMLPFSTKNILYSR